MESQHCSYLGVVAESRSVGGTDYGGVDGAQSRGVRGGDGETAPVVPAADYRCHAQKPPGTVDVIHQRDFCLTANHTNCALYALPEGLASAAQEAAEPVNETRAASHWIRYLPWAALGLILAVLAVVYGRDLLRPAPPTPAVGSVPASPVPPSPVALVQVSPTATPTQSQPAKKPASTRPPVPTPQPGGTVVTLEPSGGDTGWWATGDARAVHLDDSFLYSGHLNDQVVISAAQFDLRRLRRGASIMDATLSLTGLNDERFRPAAGGTWTVQLLDPKLVSDLGRADFQTLYNAPAAITLFPTLYPADLAVGGVNTFQLDDAARAWLEQQVLEGVPAVTARIVGPAGGDDTLFAWDSGVGPASKGNLPQLVLSLGAPPATPPPLPTELVVIATLTPTPANVLTAAANVLTATSLAPGGATSTPVPARIVTPTDLPRNFATALARSLAAGSLPLVEYTPTPANGATATANARYATAVAITTGTFTPVPRNAVTPAVVLPTALPRNAATAVAHLLTVTAEALDRDPPTPLPMGALIATITPEPPIVTSTPKPANAATAAIRAAEATLSAMTIGTYTPVPSNARTPTREPAPTPLPLVVAITRRPPATATPTPPAQMARQLVGKVLFLSDREGSTQLYAFDPANGRLYWVTRNWPHALAWAREGRSPDGQYTVEVQTVTEQGEWDVGANAFLGGRQAPQLFIRDNQFNVSRRLTSNMTADYDPAWSPAGDRIVFVSAAPGNDEIYTIRPDGSDLQRLTSNSWEWDKHPTWSPDGKQIVFWSNRGSGRRQLWIMNADGSNQRSLLESGYNDWDPVWVK